MCAQCMCTGIVTTHIIRKEEKEGPWFVLKIWFLLLALLVNVGMYTDQLIAFTAMVL